eukprot:comp12648_c0_seq1/m.7704 comp12648_c0_seq1/g.7704  ORF comp12648_c0_seq1/g.7704 comp12648_c0_seq1/m.7704 type:complete len:354 (-) comp12648_c0_seq1:98-1159(-)
MGALQQLRRALGAGPLNTGLRIAARRLHTQFERGTVPAFVLDIDGVLTRGDVVLPQAREAMRILTGQADTPRVPFVFLTNGGGCKEAKKAKQLSDWLDVEVNPSQVVLSHTPMREFTEYFDKHVLLLGQGPLKDIARDYGFMRVCTMDDVASAYPLLDVMDKSKRYSDLGSEPLEPIEGVFVMTDPLKWERQLQVLCDILTSHGTPGMQAPHQVVPIWFTNPDFLWAAQHSQPRFGQGAFRMCLETLYQRLTGHPLKAGQFGKPHALTYDYALGLLKRQAHDLGYNKLGWVYGVGDNPLSDIRGANEQEIMRSVLVRTGVFTGPGNDVTDPANHVVDDVVDAVRLGMGLPPYA